MVSTGYFPILDYDPDPRDIVGSSIGATDVALPKVAVMAILGDKVAQFAASESAAQLAKFDFFTVNYPIYGISRGDRQVALIETPIGGAAAAMVMQNLIRAGVSSIIMVGSCGVLTDIPEGTFVVPTRALRDEGTSYHYLPASPWVATDKELSASCTKALAAAGLAVLPAATWTTDGFYRETEQLVALRKEQGCAVVEMECASLAACAAFNEVAFAQILFTADSLNSKTYQPRNFGVDSHQAALELALDAAFLVA